MASAAPVVLNRRHVYMLPTGPGYLFGVSAFAMLLTATNYGNGLAYGFCFLLVAIAVVSMLFTQRNLQGLSVSPVSAEPVFAGEQLVALRYLCDFIGGRSDAARISGDRDL